jgi:hypothetical protein
MDINTIKICDKNSHCLYCATEFIHDDLFFENKTKNF